MKDSLVSLPITIPEVSIPIQAPFQAPVQPLPQWYMTVASEVQIIIALALLLGSQLTVQYLKDVLTKAAKHRKLKKEWSLSTEQEIRHIVIKINALLNAKRTLVSYFHNGTITTSDQSLKFITCAYEDVSPGTQSISHKVKAFPLTRLLTQITSLMDGRWKKVRRENLSEGGCKAHLYSIGVDFLCERILKRDDIPVGLISIHFGKETEDLPDEKLFEISELVNRLGAIL